MPRKLYHMVDDSDQEDESEDSDSESQEVEENEVSLECNLSTEPDPVTWKDVESRGDADVWTEAMEDEYLAQIRNNTWEITLRPQARKVIGSRFVFKTKENGLIEKKKVRLVANGCSQRPGEDFHETYSPVVRSTTIRLLAAMSAELGLEMHQMDVGTAYLNGELEESVYIEMPDKLR